MNTTKTGIIIGRFQTPVLNEDQKNIFNTVLAYGHTKNIVVLGISPLLCTSNNPLDFEARRLMIENEFPGKFTFLYIKDQNDDEVWSKNFDELIEKYGNDITIYGSRDYFHKHYIGAHWKSFVEILQTVYSSDKENLKNLSKQIKSSTEWRTGVVYATQNRYPTVYSTVDCAIFEDHSYERIYMAKKPNEKLYRFVGGFVDVNDDSFEDAAIREAKEETCLDCWVVDYCCSRKIDDFRYRNERDKIITHLFAMVKVSGRAVPSDDVCVVELLKFNDIDESMIQPEHREIFSELVIWVKSQKARKTKV